MEIKIVVDEVTLDTVVADVLSYDEYGDTVTEGEKRVADLVADQIVQRVAGSPEFDGLKKRVTAIRDEMIREELKPLLAETMHAPIRKTNAYGEPTGEVVTMRELVIEEARNLLNNPDRSYGNRAPWVRNLIKDMVRNLFEKELKEQINQARAALQKELETQMHVHVVQPAITKAMKNAGERG